MTLFEPLRTVLAVLRDLSRPLYSFRAIIHSIPRERMGENPMLLAEPLLETSNEIEFPAYSGYEAYQHIEAYCQQFRDRGMACYCVAAGVINSSPVGTALEYRLMHFALKGDCR